MIEYIQFHPQGFRDGFLCGTAELPSETPYRYSVSLASATVYLGDSRYTVEVCVTDVNFAKMRKDKMRWNAVFSHCAYLAKSGATSLARFDTHNKIDVPKPILQWGKFK